MLPNNPSAYHEITMKMMSTLQDTLSMDDSEVTREITKRQRKNKDNALWLQQLSTTTSATEDIKCILNRPKVSSGVAFINWTLNSVPSAVSKEK